MGQEGAGDRDSLALAAGERGALFADFGIVAWNSSGGRVQNEHVVIGSWPVQILPAYTPLVEEAVLAATDRTFDGVVVPVVSAEHLCAIALQTGRAKDYARVNAFVVAGAVDGAALRELIARLALGERWQTYERRYT